MHQREGLRQELVKLDLRAAAATRSGFITNSAEIINDTRRAIEERLDDPLLPD